MPEANAGSRLHSLIQAIEGHARFNHPVERFEEIETHISLVLLTGPYAYKFKKPVNLGFLDFSTLELRKFYCDEELRLNRRLLPDVYLEVVAITGSEDFPEFGGEGPVLEYAVKMLQFEPGHELNRMIDSKRVMPGQIDDLAKQIADFHRSIASAGFSDPYGFPETMLHSVYENFSQIEEFFEPHGDAGQKVSLLKQWSKSEYGHLYQALADRKRQGFVRECHGDLHLGNIVIHAGRVAIFDCIEFSKNLRWIDVINEIAFLFMDLECRKQISFAYRLLNRYLESSGDYAGLRLLRFYKIYRSLVRAKIALLSPHHETHSDRSLALFEHYLDYALNAVSRPKQKAFLLITHGLSGSGKSTLALSLCESLPAIRISSDIERKRLCGFEALARSASGIQSGIYTDEITTKTYEKLQQYAQTIIEAGYAVIVDGTFLKKQLRDTFRDLAARLAAPFLILDVQAAVSTLEQRIARRAERNDSVSEADQNVLSFQIASMDPLDDQELKHSLRIDTGLEVDVPHVVAEILATVETQQGW